jgi:hypothetical protein
VRSRLAEDDDDQINRFLMLVEVVQDADLSGEICLIFAIVEHVMISPNYVARVVLPDQLRWCFLRMRPEMEIAMNIFWKIVDLSILLYSSEIDEAVMEIDDFRGILNWFPRRQAHEKVVELINDLMANPTPTAALNQSKTRVARYSS